MVSFHLPIVEDPDAAWVQRLAAVEDEAVVLSQKTAPCRSRPLCTQACPSALIEVAEALEVVTVRVEQEDIDLMVGYAHLVVAPESTESLSRQLAQVVKVGYAIEPHRQVDVLRFVNVTTPPVT